MNQNPLKLVVFDLDFTLWNAGDVWCDCLTPPFRVESGDVRDARGAAIRLYPDVLDILDRLDTLDIQMALASRTKEPDWANELLELLSVRHRFSFAEIYPSSKIHHFERLRTSSGAAFEEMLFFDDEERNVIEVGQLGVATYYVSQGMSKGLFKKGLERFGLTLP